MDIPSFHSFFGLQLGKKLSKSKVFIMKNNWREHKNIST